MITALVTANLGKLAALIVALIAVLAAYLRGRSGANAKAEQKANEANHVRIVAEAKHEAETVKEQSNVQAQISRMPTSVVIDKLRKHWTRP